MFSGYDGRAPMGYHVFEQSIIETSSRPLAITPLSLTTLKGVYTRPRSPTQLTDFSFSRFLVPFLSGYEGWSLFVDGSDMLVRTDIAKLWELREDKYAVMVVKHPEYSGEHSFMGRTITVYPKWNWSSVMLFNNAKCKTLSPDIVNGAEPLFLHQFQWLESPELIGELPATWNHLVGYHPLQSDVNLVHWTKGAPYEGGEYAISEYAQEWFEMKKKMEINITVPSSSK
jgi:hypothetical protein